MKEQKILHLTLKKKWFDMILSGEKTEEYRETKVYWWKRLSSMKDGNTHWNQFDIVRFTNGYGKNAPRFDIDFLSINLGHGIPEWGAEKGKTYFVLTLGKVLPDSVFV